MVSRPTQYSDPNLGRDPYVEEHSVDNASLRTNSQAEQAQIPNL